jgi:hypothetical protein
VHDLVPQGLTDQCGSYKKTLNANPSASFLFDAGSLVKLQVIAQRRWPMHLGIKKTTLAFERWIGYGEEKHKEVLAEINALFDEHSMLPYNDYFIDAVNDFKVAILDRAVPGWRDQPSTWGLKEVDDWYHEKIGVHGTKFLLLGIIRDKGSEHLQNTLAQFTPVYVATPLSASPAP